MERVGWYAGERLSLAPQRACSLTRSARHQPRPRADNHSSSVSPHPPTIQVSSLIFSINFSQLHDIDVRVVTAGTGAVLNMASRGDVSAVLVHAPEDEEAFVAEGFGIDRRSVMANRFFIVGPEKDPAGIGAASERC